MAYSPNGVDVTIDPGVDITLGPDIDVAIAPVKRAAAPKESEIDLPAKWEEPKAPKAPKTKKAAKQPTSR